MHKTIKTFFMSLIVFTLSASASLHDFEIQHMKDIHGTEIDKELTFFKIHDIDDDGFWDIQELRIMFGIEYALNPKSHQVRRVIDQVYSHADTNKDKFISVDEYLHNELAFLKPIKQREEGKIRAKRNNKNNSDITHLESLQRIPNKYQA